MTIDHPTFNNQKRKKKYKNLKKKQDFGKIFSLQNSNFCCDQFFFFLTYHFYTFY